MKVADIVIGGEYLLKQSRRNIGGRVKILEVGKNLTDKDGKVIDASKHCYSVRFVPWQRNQLHPEYVGTARVRLVVCPWAEEAERREDEQLELEALRARNDWAVNTAQDQLKQIEDTLRALNTRIRGIGKRIRNAQDSKDQAQMSVLTLRDCAIVIRSLGKLSERPDGVTPEKLDKD